MPCTFTGNPLSLSFSARIDSLVFFLRRGSNMPLYKSWSQSSFRDRAWFLCYHGAVRRGDEILMKQPIEFAR